MKLRPGNPEEVGMSSARIRHVADLAQGWVNQGVTPALVVLVARRGVIVLHEAFGRLTPEVGAPPLPRDALFPLSSISKPITATAAMILVEEGRLGLNRPVVEYIPELTGEGKQSILVHHLLTHTSGLRDEDVWLCAEKKYQTGFTVPPAEKTQHPLLNQWLVYGYDTPLWKKPGEEMSYSNYGFELLGEIVRRLNNQSLHDFATDRIFTPLGMQDSWYIVPEQALKRVVKRPDNALYAGPQCPVWNASSSFCKAIAGGFNDLSNLAIPRASASVYSTAYDTASFGQLFLSRGRCQEYQILSPTSVVAMTRNHIPGVQATFGDEILPEASWGLGWHIQGLHKFLYDGVLHSPQTFDHIGAGGVQLWVDPVNELIGVYFSVVLRTTENGFHPAWPVDLFKNAVMAAIVD